MRRTFVIAVLAVGIVIGFAGASALQEGTTPKEGGEQEGWVPPGPLEDPISDKMTGQWKWEGKMWMNGQETPMVAKEDVRWGLGHQFVLHAYKQEAPDGTVTYEALGVGRPDPETGKTKLWWFDSHGQLTVWDGERTENGEKATAETPGGNMKMTVEVKEDGTVRHVMHYAMPGSDDWQPLMDATGSKVGMGGGKGEGPAGKHGKSGKMGGDR